MKSKVILFVLCGLLALTGQALAETLEEVLAKNLEVRGGEEAIPGGKTVQLTQKNTVAEARKSAAFIVKRDEPKYNK